MKTATYNSIEEFIMELGERDILLVRVESNGYVQAKKDADGTYLHIPMQSCALTALDIDRNEIVAFTHAVESAKSVGLIDTIKILLQMAGLNTMSGKWTDESVEEFRSVAKKLI